MLLDNPSINLEKNPLFIVISGSSGVGKDATLVKMRESGFVFHYVVTATTRQKRPGEIEGQDYLFITKDKFNQMVKANEFLEWAEVYGNYYGVPKKIIRSFNSSE